MFPLLKYQELKIVMFFRMFLWLLFIQKYLGLLKSAIRKYMPLSLSAEFSLLHQWSPPQPLHRNTQ